MIFKDIQDSDIKSAKSYLNQLIDVIQEDISSSYSRKKYQHFITGGVGPDLASSLFQTIYDQDFTLQTANPIFDITVGLNPTGEIVTSARSGIDVYGKELFPANTLMMREKMDTYRQFAQLLLGDSSLSFIFSDDTTNVTGIGSSWTDSENIVDSALFVSFKRLFSRDSIKEGTFAMRTFISGSNLVGNNNINITSELGEQLITDYGQKKESDIAGSHANLINASTNKVVGQIYYERGILVFDMAKLFAKNQLIKGSIRTVNYYTGYTNLGSSTNGGNVNAKFIPDLMVSGSVDEIIDHVCGTRFSSGSFSAMTYQNITNINSTLIFCRADADMFNYSQNPTYKDSSNRIVVIPPGEENTQKSYTFITTVGLYDADQNLLAVSKLSRPIEKTPETEVNLRLRLDF